MLSINLQDAMQEAEPPSSWDRLTRLAWLAIQYGAIRLKVRVLARLLLKQLKRKAFKTAKHLIPISESVRNINFTVEDTSKLGSLIHSITSLIDEVSTDQGFVEELGLKHSLPITKITLANQQTLTALYSALRQLKKHSYKLPKPADELAISAASKSADTLNRIYAR